MPFLPRCLPPDAEDCWVDVTLRTVDARYLFVPGSEFNDRTLGLLAIVTRRYRVGVGCVHIASNHLHLLIRVPDANTQGAFLRDLDSGIARLARRLHGGEGHVFARRPTIIPVLDDDALAQRYRYYFDQATKDNLTARPRDWVGVHCVNALCRGDALRGKRIDRTLLRSRARAASGSITEADCTRWLDLELTPPPFLEGLPIEAQRAWFGRLEAEIEEETQQRQGRERITPPTAAALRAVDPFAHPRAPKRSPAPKVLTTVKALRDVFIATLTEFVDVFRDAWWRMYRGMAFSFPDNGFVPGREPMRRPDEHMTTVCALE
ncbi:MAG: hypothetical protein KC620_10275 [Myxococcales bacterium]|nr:hypothetical protein [Myxococcales bacterium]